MGEEAESAGQTANCRPGPSAPLAQAEQEPQPELPASFGDDSADGRAATAWWTEFRAKEAREFAAAQAQIGRFKYLSIENDVRLARKWGPKHNWTEEQIMEKARARRPFFTAAATLRGGGRLE